MSNKWSRVYKSETHPIYAYSNNDVEGLYKVHAYSFRRVFSGEAAMLNMIQYLKDFGDYGVDNKTVRAIKSSYEHN